ncbi:MAG: transporter substrate-binding domain-containing protein, partial [Clostridia bacterium]|nr:transporter substrate-binding domain-containing protein [Clostridia bacterium]
MRKWRLSLFGAKRLTAFMLSFAMLALLTLPLTAYAAKDRGKVVRVGWYESPFNTTDASGQRDGYAYVYQQKIAAYTGWTYEYVEGSWPDLLQMLIDGKIDLMSDVSYTEERAELMQFSSLQMGAEEYYLYIAPGNNDITLNDYSTFNGKKVGVNANSYQKGLYEEWAATHELETEIVELTGGEEDLLQKLTSGEIDALVTLDVYGDPNRAIPLCKIGSSDFYFAVRNDRGDLLSELDSAMNRIISDDRNYNQELYEKYFSSIGTNLFLSDVEKTGLASHGTVKVGYMKDYLPFCAKDPETRQLTGALKEYLEYAAGAIQNADLKFDAIAFDTIGEAIEALKAGQVNCVFPANFGEADAEEMGLIITPSVMSAEIYEIVREDDLQDFGKKRNVKVAVDEGNVNYEKVLSEKFPDFEVVHYRNIKSCLQAVADGKADTVLVSNFRYNNLTKQCDKLGLTPIATGIGMGNAFVAVRGDIELYSLLNKTVNMVPASKTNSVMTLYISEKEEELTFTEFVMKHLAEVMGIVAGVLLVILALSMRTIRAMKRARRDEKLIASAETDQLTGVYSKNFLFEYARRMQNKHKNKPMDAIVVDIERFHSINTLNGQEAGDQVLRTLGEVLRTVFNDKNTIVGRIDANRFCIFRWNKWNDHDYADFLNQLQTGLEEKNPNLKLRLRMGVFPAQTGREPEKMYDRARIASNIARGQYKMVPLVVYDEVVNKKRLYDQRL